MDIVRVALFILCVVLQCTNAKSPTVTLQVFKNGGFRATAMWYRDITFFAFKGIINNSTRATIFIRGYGSRSNNFRWVFEDPKVKAEIGDIITYRAFFSSEMGIFIFNESLIGIHGSFTETQSFQVTELEENPDVKTKCEPSLTILRSGTACRGQTILHDDFDTLDTDTWQIEHYIPMDHPEAPFVSYQRLLSNPTVYVDGGMLYIQPKLQQDLPGFTNESIISGTLDLSAGCTRPPCKYQALGDIVPPVVSGRVTTARFAFTYGTVTVRAKLPQGDWLYPEILLEPLANKYGSINYASGVFKLAMALGNRDVDMTLYSNKYLKGWPILNGKCHSALQSFGSSAPFGHFWGEDFHEYTLIWTPDGIEFGVDGKSYARYDAGHAGLRSWLPQQCRMDSWYSLLAAGGLMAPFNEHFFITLGVAAGGVVEFPDVIRSRGISKPWRNSERKARVKFWEALSDWYPTWDKSALVIDYIKVVAL